MRNNLVTEGGEVKGSLYFWVKTSASNSVETIPTNYGDVSCNCVESILSKQPVVPSCKNITKHAMHHVGTGSTLVWRDGIGGI